jgi:hypothetical protein
MTGPKSVKPSEITESGDRKLHIGTMDGAYVGLPTHQTEVECLQFYLGFRRSSHWVFIGQFFFSKHYINYNNC